MKKARFSAALGVLLVHTAASAQQGATPDAGPPSPAPPAAAPAPPAARPAPAPPATARPLPRRAPAAPATTPPPAAPAPQYPYGPPPGYGTPPPPPPQQLPPSYYYYPPPPPPPRGVWRPFTISLGLGYGGLSIPGGAGADDPRDWESSLAYQARVGFGVNRNWVVFLGLDGGSVDTLNEELTVTDYLIGAQFFLVPQLYARAGMGLASVRAGPLDYAMGQAFLAAIGFEFLQGDNVALGAEAATALSRFSAGTYFHNVAGLSLSFY